MTGRRRNNYNNRKKPIPKENKNLRNRWDDSSIYEVEAILNKRLFKGKIQYLIQWKGYGLSENSWEPRENIESVTPGLIEYFEENFNDTDSSSSSSDDEVLANLVRSKPVPVKVHGICQHKPKDNGDDAENFGFLISFSDGRAKVVPREKAHEICPQLVIRYYETCISFSDELEDLSFSKEDDNNKNNNTETCETSAGAELFIADNEEFQEKVSSSGDKDPLDCGSMLPSVKSENMEVESSATRSVFEDMHSEECLISSSGL